MQEVENVLRILRETKSLIEQDRPDEIKNLSNQTIHTAAVYQDPDNIIVAVLVYSLSKILERENYKSLSGWSVFYKSVLKNLDDAIRYLEEGKINKCRNSLGKIRSSINKIEGDLGFYIEDVFKKAQINKAFKLYEHGLSSQKTARLLGISLWDLSSYIGQSSVYEGNVSQGISTEKRLKIAMEAFS